MGRQGFTEETRYTPWWWEAAPPRGPTDVTLPASADVAVIGSGYTGLSAALTLARAGRRVVVMDSHAPGHGASTRNGGQVGSGNQRHTVADLIASHGRDKARALMEEGFAMLRHTGELIEKEGIDCHFSRVGRFRGAAIPAHYDAMARDMEDLKSLVSVDAHMVPRAEQHREVGSDFYHGGLVLPGDAGLHPALYHRGLLECTESAGAQIVPFTPVMGIARESGGIVVASTRGRLMARSVVVATNGYTGAPFPDLKLRVVPIGSAIIATEPLPEGVMNRLMPGRRMMGSSARIYHYYRACPEGRRVLFGGRISGWSLPESPSGFAHLHRDMLRVFPELRGVAISHAWSGYVAYTSDALPHLGGRDGIYHAMGYCGSGVARATYFGHKTALKVLGHKDGDTSFDDVNFSRFPAHFMAARWVPVAVAWYRFRDWLDRAA